MYLKILKINKKFDIPDNVLSSTIGKYDGNAYEALFNAARKSTLNQ